MSTIDLRPDFASEPDRERDESSRLDLQLIATRDELQTVRAELEGAQVERKALRSQARPSSIVRETLDMEKTRALRAEGTIQTERARAEAALAAVHEARQQTAAALAELELERRDVAVLRTALDEATAAAGTGTESTAAPGWDGAAQVAVAETLGAITDMRVALKEIVRVLGTRGGWDAVVAWCPEERRPTMGCVGMWTGGAADLRGLETKTWQARRNPAAGEFGAAWTHNGATCMPDLGAADDRLLRDAAAAGMNAAMFIPIQAGQEKVGALEFWSRGSTPPNADVILFLEALGLQLGSHAEMINRAASPRWRVGRD